MGPDRVDESRIDATLVRTLLAEQFPAWRDRPLRPVSPGGDDHRMFRLGDDLSVRLPSAPGSVPQVVKEQTWLPRLAPAVPLPVPAVLGVGRPSAHFGAPWSVYGWLEGRPASSVDVEDPVRLAEDLAAFLVALRAVDPAGGPGPGPHSAYRGGPLDHWDEEVHDLLHRVHGRERDHAAGLWRDALAVPFVGTPRWFHGDVSTNNLLVRDGVLAAVLDFGCSGVGDPACDTVLLWTRLHGRAREAFREGLGLDEATWARGRGWALWKALIMITNKPPGQAELARHVLNELFAGV
ncbi:aminoglycoside phosphotransferase family protein [Cellulomonas aerilata]|uniref:Aminoglycoside phosphotransferase n=1 Tax=Cellulomonas aerilata TaxID=515326 RepID=A0A512D9X9_9CELL|nr:aminoglycoside phosphotransferase family protein [Cellulomonas aerilata]GEO33276.1 aminoglycoside phosphotransferase [Cellulomonas aerilata]